MKIKYILYLLAVVALIATMVYARDNIGLWLSQVGTYIVILCTTFLAGWILGAWGMRNRYKSKLSENQKRLAESQKQLSECEKAKAALEQKVVSASAPSPASSGMVGA